MNNADKETKKGQAQEPKPGSIENVLDAFKKHPYLWHFGNPDDFIDDTYGGIEEKKLNPIVFSLSSAVGYSKNETTVYYLKMTQDQKITLLALPSEEGIGLIPYLQDKHRTAYPSEEIGLIILNEYADFNPTDYEEIICLKKRQTASCISAIIYKADEKEKFADHLKQWFLKTCSGGKKIRVESIKKLFSS